jgi:hypothetical protein
MSIVYIQIMKSDLDGKKYKAVFYNKDRSKVKTTHFGAKGMSDYNIHKDDERKERYQDIRLEKIGMITPVLEVWRGGYYGIKHHYQHLLMII